MGALGTDWLSKVMLSATKKLIPNSILNSPLSYITILTIPPILSSGKIVITSMGRRTSSMNTLHLILHHYKTPVHFLFFPIKQKRFSSVPNDREDILPNN